MDTMTLSIQTAIRTPAFYADLTGGLPIFAGTVGIESNFNVFTAEEGRTADFPLLHLFESSLPSNLEIRRIYDVWLSPIENPNVNNLFEKIEVKLEQGNPILEIQSFRGANAIQIPVTIFLKCDVASRGY